MKKSMLVLAMLMLSLLSGCMTFPTAIKADSTSELKAKTFVPDPGTATIYVYRQDVFLASALSYPITIDNQYVGAVVRGTFCAIPVPPGKHTVTSSLMLEAEKVGSNPDRSINLEVVSGANYFLWQEVAFGAGNMLQTIDEGTGKQVVSTLHMIAIPDQAVQKIAAVTQPSLATAINLPLANKLTIPTPIHGNGGNYMSPFTASGNVAAWAIPTEAVAPAGSDLSANMGGLVGEQIGNKVLDFVPFGLGGMIGKQAGSAAGRSTQSPPPQPEIPSLERIRASSDISFQTANELAVYLYAKYSTHREYARILLLTQKVYPELTSVYGPAIQQAAKAAEQTPEPHLTASESKKSSPKERLKVLQQLKQDGLISDAEYRDKRAQILGHL